MILEILSGEKTGTAWNILEGKVIGRKVGDYIVPDIKVSAQHAKVVSRGDQFFLVDLGSANGIKHNGQTVRELELTPAVEFLIGRTLFRVKLAPDLVTNEDSSALIAQADPNSAGSEGLTPAAKLPAWAEAIIALNESLRFKPPPLSRFISVPGRPVVLRVIQGAQTGDEWSIGFGPRRFGSDPLENTIWDDDLPLVCFQIYFENGIALIRSEAINLVFVNDIALREHRLSNGDIIRVKNTKIKVILKT